jgi:hypothetical protein
MEKQVWIYAYNESPTAPPEIDAGYPRKPPLPEDEPDEPTLAVLESAFPGMAVDELLRLEDHIRHNERTRLCACRKDEVSGLLAKLQIVPAHLRVAAERMGKKAADGGSDMLPSVHDGQWRVCVGCPHFTLRERVARCGKRWCCKWGASTPHEWDVDRDPMWYHPQCPRIARHFRFEALLLYYTGNAEFEDEILAHGDAERLASERERLLRRDVAAAAEAGDFVRIRKRCAELGESFADFAAKYDILGRMLKFWCVSRRLVDNVKLLREEGIPIPEAWRDELFALPADDEDRAARKELHRLLENLETR